MIYDTQFATVDLTNCDREPIHIPGAVQPHGVILVLAEPALTILQVSANSADHFGLPAESLVCQPLSALLREENIYYLRERILPKELESSPHYLTPMLIGPQGSLFEGIIHRSQGLLLLELEVCTNQGDIPTNELYATLKHTLEQLHKATTLQSFCQLAAEQVRQFTGYDRVLVYQFREDDTGHVIAEDRRPDLDSYLGLHYPASDIPRQARALYLKSWLRLICDIDAPPAPLVPLLNSQTQAPLDLSYAVTRSMSPIHREYLRNMGVRASMSMSIIHEGRLWGLIACHHTTPRYIPHPVRTACEFLAHTLSLQLGAKEAAEHHNYVSHLNTIHTQLIARMAAADNYRNGLIGDEPNLLSGIVADGVAIAGEAIALIGRTPTEQQVRQLVAWLRDEVDQPLYATSALATVFSPAKEYPELASGLLAARLSKYQSEYLLWFRGEYRHQVDWAGNPNKPVQVGPLGTRLTPRASFAVWSQEVAGTSVPWIEPELEAAATLRRAILELIIHRADELARLNTELERSNIELDSFAYIASHDLKEPLRGIHNYSHFLLEDYADRLDSDGSEKLHTLIRLTQRMESLIDSLLHYSRLGRIDMAFTAVDLNQELHDVLTLLGPRIREHNVIVRVPRPLPVMNVDRARVGEVFINLIANAIKYNDKAERWVEIGYEEHPEDAPAGLAGPVFYIRDNGIGILAEHQEAIFRIFKRLHPRDAYGGGVGAGLTIVKKIIERHGGTIWVRSELGVGTTFYFTLAAPRHDSQRDDSAIGGDGATKES